MKKFEATARKESYDPDFEQIAQKIIDLEKNNKSFKESVRLVFNDFGLQAIKPEVEQRKTWSRWLKKIIPYYKKYKGQQAKYNDIELKKQIADAGFIQKKEEERAGETYKKLGLTGTN